MRNPVRCHLMNVSGLTITKALRQSKNVLSATINSRVMGVVRPARTFRSWCRASCRLRNRFSANSAAREIMRIRRSAIKSAVYNGLRRVLEAPGSIICAPQDLNERLSVATAGAAPLNRCHLLGWLD